MNEVPWSWSYGRKNGKTSVRNTALRVALACGDHVHLCDRDGLWCLDDATCDAAGSTPDLTHLNDGAGRAHDA